MPLRPTQFKKHVSHLFLSPLCETAIPARNPILRDALVQATLDPLVRKIEYLDAAVIDGIRIRLSAIILTTRDEGRAVLDIVDARPLRAIDDEGYFLHALARLNIALLETTTADVRREPRWTSARECWSYRKYQVRPSDRANILRALQDEGPLSILQLAHRVSTRSDLEHCVYALACDAVVHIDLMKGLGHHTIVRPSDFRASSRPALAYGSI